MRFKMTDAFTQQVRTIAVIVIALSWGCVSSRDAEFMRDMTSIASAGGLKDGGVPDPPVSAATDGGVVSHKYHIAGYSIAPPEGADWSVATNAADETIVFERKQTQGRPHGVVRVTRINIGTNWTSGKNDKLTEEEVANDYRAGEELNMRNSGARQYSLSDVKKGVTVLGDKKLYFMSYVTTPRSGPGQSSILYLWFPEDFMRKRKFFVINLDDICSTDEAEQCPDVKALTSVVQSLGTS